MRGELPGRRDGWRQIPTAIWTLGVVSLFMDTSSEMIHALLPVYIVSVLGSSALTVGFLEGVAEATAAITKIFSGALSDRLGRRKFFAALGYGLAAFSKPIFPLAPTVDWLFLARFVDRIGKGIRGAPRDALIGDIAPVNLRGASFGLRQSLDTIGAFLGPLAAIGLMAATGNRFRTVFWIAVLPAFLSLGLIVIAVRESPRLKERRRVPSPLQARELRRMGSIYWSVVGVAAVFALARFSEAFLVLRAQSLGVPLVLIPSVLVAMNITYAASAYPLGALSDRADRITVLAVGLGLLVIADIALAFASDITGLAIGVLLWGLHMGFTQGLFAALITDTAPPDLRGTAFGTFNLVTGLALFLASVVAGALWSTVGPEGTFLAGSTFAFATLTGVLLLRKRLHAAPDRRGDS